MSEELNKLNKEDPKNIPCEEIKAIQDYFRTGMQLRQPLDLTSFPTINRTFTWQEVKDEIRKFKLANPEGHKYLTMYWTHKDRTRNQVALGLHIDSSTLRRKWNQGSLQVLGGLLNKDLNSDYPAIDLRFQEGVEASILPKLTPDNAHRIEFQVKAIQKEFNNIDPKLKKLQEYKDIILEVEQSLYNLQELKMGIFTILEGA